jgi:hypothetical protein
LRRQTFETAIIERYRRRESSVEEALIEMYLAGISVRRVEDITEALWGTRVSPSTVSNLNKKIYAKIEAWRNRRIEGEHPYLYLDGIAREPSCTRWRATCSSVAPSGRSWLVRPWRSRETDSGKPQEFLANSLRVPRERSARIITEHCASPEASPYISHYLCMIGQICDETCLLFCRCGTPWRLETRECLNDYLTTMLAESTRIWGYQTNLAACAGNGRFRVN